VISSSTAPEARGRSRANVPGVSRRPRAAEWRRTAEPRRGVPVRRRRGEAGAARSDRVKELTGTDATLGGVAAEDRDFVHAVYGELPVRARVRRPADVRPAARAFRSLVLPLKAVILNLVSLGAAYGIIVFIFQQGHGSEAIWTCRDARRSSRGSR
jgi:RND superfamily putative drug exporter